MISFTNSYSFINKSRQELLNDINIINKKYQTKIELVKNELYITYFLKEGEVQRLGIVFRFDNNDIITNYDVMISDYHELFEYFGLK